ncbi:MAG TPA: DUF2064 domain-containing protein [Pyrinomonadaceae bacterium]|nr:DUF2064 domain-containing protein [Pyrinomonadaceae bacterium]
MSPSLQKSPQFRCALALMATVPGPRLDDPEARPTPPLTRLEATELKHLFLRDLGATIGRIVDDHRADGIVVFTPRRAESLVRQLVPKNFKLFPQRGENVGEVLANAIEDLLNKGFPAVCLINCDSPTLPVSLLEVAIESLSRPGDRMVLGAVDGGGFYLLGLKQPHRELFERISSSASNVVAHTNALAASIGLKVEALPQWYDVNDPKSLNRLCVELLGPDGPVLCPAPFTRQYLVKLIEAEGPARISPGLAGRI